MELLFKTIKTFFRAFGLFAITFPLLAGILLGNNRYLLLSLFLFIDVLLNIFLKKTSRILMGKKNFPIIGSGLRPKGKKSCGYFDTNVKIKRLNETYGMPSGHSQTFAFIATLIGLHLYKKNEKYKLFKYAALVFLTLLAMYMRVYVENCHTIQQTIVGVGIGIILAYVLVKHFGNPFDIT